MELLQETNGVNSEWLFSPSEIELTSTVLGRGAFGEVRIANWRNIDVACKSLHTIDENVDQTDKDNMNHEISMLTKLRHPNLVLFLGVCYNPVSKTTSILTELLPCSLYDLIEVKKANLKLADVLDISLDIAYGLDYLHKHTPQIVHRDISSKNILIGGSRAKIADLGQAKIFGHNTLSRQTGMPGAMAYSAPEVLTGKYSSKIDVFSFGVLLAQMCTGEYPRIDRREDQIALACDKQPLFRPLITSSVQYQPHERPSAERLCRSLEAIKSNDRYYPLSRTIHPEKDLGIIGRQWMEEQIERQCQTVVVELNRAKSLLVAEEQRWRLEAGKVDGINDQLRESQNQHAETLHKLSQLQAEHRELQHKFAQSEIEGNDYKSQLAVMGYEVQRMQCSVNDKDNQLTEKLQDIITLRDTLSRCQDEFQVTSQLLESSRRSEGDLLKRNEQLKLQLDMQVEYVRDLETRLEQALTRWKLEKDALREEKARTSKLNTRTAAIVSLNERNKEEIARYEARLAQYADLPVPDELRQRLQDMQDDIHLAREEVNSLLRQREEWGETKANLEQTIEDYKHRALEHEEEEERAKLTLQGKLDAIESLRIELGEAARRDQDRVSQIDELQAEIERMKESEAQTSEMLRKTRVALTRERNKLEQYQNVAMAPASATAAAGGSVLAGGSSRISNSNLISAAGGREGMESEEREEREEEENKKERGDVEEERGEGREEQVAMRSESPYILQQEIRPNMVPGGEITDLDDEDALPPVMRTLVPSITRLAEIEAVQATYPTEETRTDIGIKHMINSTAEKEGVEGLIRVVQEGHEDERVVWRGARALRELILKNETAKLSCYDSNIEIWLISLINAFDYSTVVQGHCMRLIGALAFGNDRFRRKSGERGIMSSIAKALEQHSDDETVVLHTLTAITNLTHNSLENRSRFVEMSGVDLMVATMVRFKNSAKVMRQACWAMLSLCGTDEISRTVALRGGDSAILNAMLHHRFDAGVQQYGCWALSNLALSGDEIMRKMKKKGAVEVCRIAMETHHKNSEVVRQARNTIGAFSPTAAGPASQNSNSYNTGTSSSILQSSSYSAL